MLVHNVEQGSPEWHACRLGIPTASAFDKIITAKGESSKQADGYANELLAEIMAGESLEGFEGTPWMNRGKELEAEAVQYYELQRDIETVKIGFVTTDDRTAGCSPDRLVGEDGLLEMKIPKPKNHVEYLLSPKIDRDYYPQIQGQLFVTGRAWVDIMSYHPKLPPVIVRVKRDPDYLFSMARYLSDFTKLMQEKRNKLITLGHLKEAA